MLRNVLGALIAFDSYLTTVVAQAANHQHITVGASGRSLLRM
jgi:hypothetical protein